MMVLLSAMYSLMDLSNYIDSVGLTGIKQSRAHAAALPELLSLSKIHGTYFFMNIIYSNSVIFFEIFVFHIILIQIDLQNPLFFIHSSLSA